MRAGSRSEHRMGFGSDGRWKSPRQGARPESRSRRRARNQPTRPRPAGGGRPLLRAEFSTLTFQAVARNPAMLIALGSFSGIRFQIRRGFLLKTLPKELALQPVQRALDEFLLIGGTHAPRQFSDSLSGVGRNANGTAGSIHAPMIMHASIACNCVLSAKHLKDRRGACPAGGSWPRAKATPFPAPRTDSGTCRAVWRRPLCRQPHAGWPGRS